MKLAITVIRILLGALLVFGSAPYFLNLFPQPQLTGDMKVFTEGLNAAVYLMPMVKAIELLSGMAFLAGRLVSLATVLISPIVVNILCVHIFLAPQGLPVAILLVLATGVIAYQKRENFKGLFSVK
jgi:uncharacterized membrane protein YphA (DoxX/SURF4 family)